MSLKLQIASIWLPKFLLKRELDKVARETIEGLDHVLKLCAPHMYKDLQGENVVLKGELEERRAMMASAHNIRVKSLIGALGYEKAIKLGREAMFKVGYRLGCEVRKELAVGDSLQDLISAAEVLYQVLGIEFKIVEKNGKKLLLVQSCALARYYLPETCRVLSAADEGVVYGLNEDISIEFKERITEGAKKCMAYIEMR